MTYRVATGVLAHLLPVAAGTSHETLRGRTLEAGERLRDAAAIEPNAAAAVAASAIALGLDSTFVRSCHRGERHLEGPVTAKACEMAIGPAARASCRRRPCPTAGNRASPRRPAGRAVGEHGGRTALPR